MMQLLAVVGMLLLGLSAAASPALAHSTDESKEGYLLVQQALGHLAHDGGSESIDLALEKVNDTLAALDQDGVDVVEVQLAKKALESQKVDQARALLQDSIKVALAELPAATGELTGTTLVLPALPGRDGLAARDLAFLVVSAAMLLIGLGLADWYRPADTIDDLRRLLSGPVRNDSRRS